MYLDYKNQTNDDVVAIWLMTHAKPANYNNQLTNQWRPTKFLCVHGE
jgi:hypothetical protein